MSIEEKVKVYTSALNLNFGFPDQFVERFPIAIVNRVKNLLNYNHDNFKIKSTSKLLRCSQALIGGFPEDYKLSQYCENFLGFTTLDEDHLSILKSKVAIREIKEFFELS